MKLKRRSGILMHPTSLPGLGGIGTLGKRARAFVDFLEAAGQSLWQVLPLGPTGYGNSPYSCYSAFAGNPLLIDLPTLKVKGDIVELPPAAECPNERVNYEIVASQKSLLLRNAAAQFFRTADEQRMQEYDEFCAASSWLHDYALFMALKEHFGGKSWNSWPKEIAGRDPAAVAAYSDSLRMAINVHKYMQWQFFMQWRELRSYANSKGVQIIGDIPIFVAYDSADVWSQPEQFQLDEQGDPLVVAGVPPDYFSETGQLWGNPLYDWDANEKSGFSWWIQRVKSSLLLYDWVRIDHFRGFAAYWEVPASEKTAINGSWVAAPGEKLFNALRDAIGDPLPIIAEDLGLITPDVEELRDQFRFPGMKVLHFAFGSGSDNYYLPHNYSNRCVVYTGTHDNNTTRGWFNEIGENERAHALTYLRSSENDVVREMIRAAYASVAAYAVIPIQDFFEFDASARMNTPGVATLNWEWRLAPGLLDHKLAERMREMTSFYNRLPERKELH